MGLKETLDMWTQLVAEAKKEAELEAMLNGADSKFKAFGDRAKGNAQGVCDRARQQLEEMFMLQVWGAWRIAARIEATLVKYQSRVEGKKSQLLAVQTKFRNFAVQLEGSLKDTDSARDWNTGPTSGKKMQKNSGTVSLP